MDLQKRMLPMSIQTDGLQWGSSHRLLCRPKAQSHLAMPRIDHHWKVEIDGQENQRQIQLRKETLLTTRLLRSNQHVRPWSCQLA